MITLNEAIIVHLIKNHYSFQRASVILDAFQIPFPTAGYHEIHESFRLYIQKFPHITNLTLLRINFAAHLLSGHSHQQQEIILGKLLCST